MSKNGSALVCRESDFSDIPMLICRYHLPTKNSICVVSGKEDNIQVKRLNLKYVKLQKSSKRWRK
jgi:hypothetical protein